VLIERVSSSVARAGDTVDIYGVNFGSIPGDKIVAINMGRTNRMQVLYWSDSRIRARVPAGLRPGNYRLLIYYDDSLATSSNSLQVTIEP
jgi:hypothetical protein